MKPIRVLLCVCALLSVPVFCDGMLPIIPFSGSTDFRINVGGFGGFRTSAQDVLNQAFDVSPGFGVSDLGGGIGVVKSFLLFMEVGADFRVSKASRARLFAKEAYIKELGGPRIASDVMTRIMIPILGIIDLGAQVVGGFEMGWSKFEKEHSSALSPQWSLRGGPIVRFNILGIVSLYGAVQYSLNNIRFNTDSIAKGASFLKELSNQHGLTIPVGLVLSIGDHFSVFAEFDSRLEDLSASVPLHGILNAGASIGF